MINKNWNDVRIGALFKYDNELYIKTNNEETNNARCITSKIVVSFNEKYNVDIVRFES